MNVQHDPFLALPAGLIGSQWHVPATARVRIVMYDGFKKKQFGKFMKHRFPNIVQRRRKLSGSLSAAFSLRQFAMLNFLPIFSPRLLTKAIWFKCLVHV